MTQDLSKYTSIATGCFIMYVMASGGFRPSHGLTAVLIFFGTLAHGMAITHLQLVTVAFKMCLINVTIHMGLLTMY